MAPLPRRLGQFFTARPRVVRKGPAISIGRHRAHHGAHSLYPKTARDFKSD